ncbi:YajG family lipoprotein [Humidesulfovibrio idahonensis]
MKKVLLLLSALLMLSGCAVTVDKIDVPYQGKPNITVVDGAEKVFLSVKEEDKRTVYKDRVGVKKNGYGMEMAAIVPTNDVPKTFADAISSELESVGFKMGPNGKTVKVELVRFYNDFKIGFFAGDSVADGLINVQVMNQKGEVLYSHSYEGGGIEQNIQLATGSNARAALIKAMSDIVSKVVQDKNLQAALLKEG